MVYFELAKTPLYINRYIRVICYWLKLLETDNCILKHLYENMYASSFLKLNDKLNWSCKIRDILYRYGFSDVWLSQSVVNTKLFLNEFKQRVIDNYIVEGLSFFENSSKCNLYQYIHAGHNMQFYLNRPVNSLYKTCITRYRINSHVLNIESGRYFNIVRNERICTMCNKKICRRRIPFYFRM